ncbi:ABC transporter substrate-binding protein [Chlorobium phaeovibrioides]|uniref:ABC transporter substrate-binding protein n=2 Tax=Chlorobium phaeovibrioides TaxID=1094 RepID=A0A5M8IDX2_CHLPH|nr:ABC transporter substrate-binding protein [Chlorobium phaeovibrioides]KAA6232454.1 ABC transporter substrate-binding protein [Chlorobium phaeovibrioides]MWV55333.1 ABC transporter substrate-binding protein [Chlorobium phaeovibrioides]HCD35535.1 ABC transporter substrate-binding protein [Chlorobium sp.]
MKKLFLLASVLFLTASSAEAKRIVSQSPFITYTLEYLGLSDSIVGVSRYDFLDLPQTGGIIDPDSAAIAALDPDIILTSNWTDPKTLRNVTPDGTKALVLYGFEGMKEVEKSLRVLTKELDVPGGKAKADAFPSAWRSEARKVCGGGRRVLILSSCVGSPFSFGRRTYLFDLFTEAGFRVVEDHETIRHMNPSEPIKTISGLVSRTRPEIVFVLHDADHGCAVNLDIPDVELIELDGNHFVYPAPILLKGLKDLQDIFSADNRKAS